MTASIPGSIAPAPRRVVLADDESLFRASLRQLLSVPPPVIADVYGVDVGAGFEVVGEAGSGAETVDIVRSRKPDLLITDVTMPRMSGLDAVRELAETRDAVPVLVLAEILERTELVRAVQLGVRGIVLKASPTDRLFNAMTCVVRGGSWIAPEVVTDLLETVRPLLTASAAPSGHTQWNLTPRERQVLNLLAAGSPNKEIARQFGLSEETVKHHLTSLYAKMGASNRLELALVANRHGMSAAG